MLPTDASCGEEVMMGSGWDVAVCILSKHCRDMKQQETRLRLVTLLLLMSCSALYVFTVCTDLRRREGGLDHHASDQRAAGPQEALCSPDHPEDKRSSAGFYISLKSIGEDNRDDKLPIQLGPPVASGIDYDEQERAIVIQKSGVYFLFMSASLLCHNNSEAASFKEFQVTLSRSNKLYGYNYNLTSVLDGFTCPPQNFRSVSVGELFELDESDHVKVFVYSGYKLINKLSFGGYLVSSVSAQPLLM